MMRDKDFRSLDDPGRRAALIEDLECWRDAMIEKAASHRRCADREPEHRDGFLRWSTAYERQAAHYQQAIDLLTAAPMPGKEEPR
jgi:hypothetical protein